MIEWFSYNRGKRIYVGIGISLVTILIGVVLLFINNTSKNEMEMSNSTELLFEEKVTSKVVYYESTNETWLLKDGKKVKKLSSTPHDKINLLTLPKTSDSLNVSDFEPSSALTWDSSLKDSSKFLNYLKGEGYREYRRVTTSDFIEMYLTNGTTDKRLIVFPNSFMYGVFQRDSGLPSLESYLDNYKYLGGQLNND